MKLRYIHLLLALVILLPSSGRAQGCAPLPLSGCNYIPNPEFRLIDPAGLNSAFSAGNVVDWGGYVLSVDINAGGNAQLAAPPLPAAIAHVNYASSQVNNPNYGESMAARIRKVENGKSYALSFFLSSSMPYSFIDGATFTFKIILSKCNVTGAPEQLIYCVSYDKLRSSDWAQYFVNFTANDDYDLIIVKPEVPTTGPYGYTYLHFAYPELINITDLITQGPIGPECNVELTACGVMNAEFEWTDAQGNLVSNNSEVSVNVSTPQSYTLSLRVPNAVRSSNTCSDNSTGIRVTKQIYPDCSCGILRIDRAEAGFYQHTESGWTIQPLDPCEKNILCDNRNELLTLKLSSNWQFLNNWQFFCNNPNLLTTANFVYTTGSSTSQHIEGFFGISPYQTGILEIRLNNRVLQESKSLFVKIVTHDDVPLGECDHFGARKAPTVQIIGVTETDLKKPEAVKVKTNALVYPNPVTTDFRINAVKKVKEVIVRSIEGRIVKRFAAPAMNQALSIAELSKGAYVTEIIFEDRTSVSSVIVRQ